MPSWLKSTLPGLMDSITRGPTASPSLGAPSLVRRRGLVVVIDAFRPAVLQGQGPEHRRGNGNARVVRESHRDESEEQRIDVVPEPCEKPSWSACLRDSRIRAETVRGYIQFGKSVRTHANGIILVPIIRECER